MRILIVEDEKLLSNVLSDITKGLGYSVDVAYDGDYGLDCAESNIYDAIVLDVMLPGMDGFSLLQQLRKDKVQTPVLLLTAKGSLEDRVHGLDLGADYYLTKPFDNMEYIACLRTVLRRQHPMVSEILTFGDLELSLSDSTLSVRDSSISLNPKELEIMRILISNNGKIVPKDLIVNKVWGFNSDATDNNVEAYISFLRRKLRFLNSGVSIVIKRKIGYRLEVADD